MNRSLVHGVPVFFSFVKRVLDALVDFYSCMSIHDVPVLR